MKKILLLLFVTTIFQINGQAEKKISNNLANVFKQSGKYVFFGNEPLNEYEIVFSFYNRIQNYDHLSNEQIAIASVKNAFKESALQLGKSFDAIITKDGSDRDLAVKFLPTESDKSVAVIRKTSGKYLYMECTPLNEYEIISNLKKSNPYFRTTRKKYLDGVFKKAIKKENKGFPFDGIIFNSNGSNYNSVIKFK
jgi:hypothetical protein